MGTADEKHPDRCRTREHLPTMLQREERTLETADEGQEDRMELELEAKRAIYERFAAVGRPPSVGDIAAGVGVAAPLVREVLLRLRSRRVLVLEADGESIRMAPPFSGVPTQHRVTAAGVEYYANCAWDALGIPAALHKAARVHSRCERSLEPLELEVTASGPEPSGWLFHSVVPAARWWEDIAFT